MSQPIYKVFKLINNELIFGEVLGVTTENGTEIQIKQPFTIKRNEGIPYMSDVMGSAPAAIQIHPMNILWCNPLEDFPEVFEAYKKQTSPIDYEVPKIIY